MEKLDLISKAINFFIDYLDIGILGFRLEGRTAFARTLEESLKRLYSKFISEELMNKIIKGPIKNYKEILEKGTSHIPEPKDFGLILIELFRIVEESGS